MVPLIVQGQINVIKPEEKLELARLKASLSDRLTPTRDTNGFRKLLVVLSRAGKLTFAGLAKQASASQCKPALL